MCVKAAFFSLSFIYLLILSLSSLALSFRVWCNMGIGNLETRGTIYEHKNALSLSISISILIPCLETNYKLTEKHQENCFGLVLGPYLLFATRGSMVAKKTTTFRRASPNSHYAKHGLCLG